MSGDNGAGQTGEKTITQADLDAERAYAQKAQREAQEAQNQLKDLQTRMATLTSELDTFKNKTAAGDPKAVEERVKQARTEAEEQFKKTYGTQLDELKTQNETKERELKRFRVTNVGLQKAAGKFLPEAMGFVEQAIEQNCDYVDGKIVIKGQDGKPRMSPKDPRAEMSVDEFLEEFASKNLFMVPAETRKGTDNGTKKAASADTAEVKPPPAGFENWTEADRTKWMMENPASARALMRKAGFVVNPN